MLKLKNLPTLLLSLFLLTFSANAFAQGLSIEVNFSKKSTTSIAYDYHFALQNTFVGLSAYCKNISDDYQLKYSIKQNNVWSEWISINPYTEGELMDRKSFEAAPITQHFEAIRFSASIPLAEPVFFRLFQADNQLNYPDKNIQQAINTCNCETPSFCNRECWCPSGNCPVDLTPSFTTPSHIIIHHSAGFNNSPDFKAVVAYYWDFHVNTNGWDDISYNWLIDPNGVVYQGRGDRVQGAHFSCMNAGTIGICMIGDFQNQTPSPAAMEMLRNLLAAELCDKSLDPNNSSLHQSSQLNLPIISSHRDGNSSTAANSCASGTVCPGGMFYNLLPDLRTAVSGMPCLALGVGQLESTKEFTLVTNPSKKLSLSIKHPENYQLRVMDYLGKVVFEQKIENKSANELLSFELKLPDGVYFVQLFNDNTSQMATWLKQ